MTNTMISFLLFILSMGLSAAWFFSVIYYAIYKIETYIIDWINPLEDVHPK